MFVPPYDLPNGGSVDIFLGGIVSMVLVPWKLVLFIFHYSRGVKSQQGFSTGIGL